MSISKRAFYLFTLCSLLIGCYSSPRFGEERRTPKTSKPSSAPTAKQDNETTATTSSRKPLLVLEGVASYYAGDFHGKVTSNGEQYDMYSLTAAHRTFPFGTKVRVVNLDNNKSVIIRINDRGPFHESRIIDLSYGAAKALDMLQRGTARVRLEVIEWGKGQ